jgi:peptide/nickel transport system permease protein
VRSVGRTARAITRTTEGRIGLALAGAVLLVLLAGPFLAPDDPNAVGAGIPGTPPSSEHLLGTDELGRDVLSRLLTGGIGVIAVPLFAVTVAFLVAGAIGMSAAYRGGRFDRVTVRVVDVMLPIPPLLVALVLLTRAEGGFLALSLVVALVFVPRMIRVLRGAAQQTIAMDYVLAAEARGEPRSRIVFGEMLPNMAAPLFVEYGIRLNFAVVFIASLNFLGFGAQPPSSNWALMVSESVDLLHANPWAAIAPMVALALLVVGVNFITDAATRVVTPDSETDRRR